MRKMGVIIAVMLGLLISSISQGQVDIRTPMGSQVVCVWVRDADPDLEASATLAAENLREAIGWDSVTELEPASTQYNCHAYDLTSVRECPMSESREPATRSRRGR